MRVESRTPEPVVLPAGRLLIGWKEWLDFPDWGLRHVRAKVDTGALTSALDVVRYRIEEAAGEHVATLELALDRRHPDRLTLVRALVLDTVVVKNSGGHREFRPVIEALVRLGPVQKRIRLTVTNRAPMRHPILLGRRALAGDFVVDVTRKYLLKARPG
jgi:hypothetical protein